MVLINVKPLISAYMNQKDSKFNVQTNTGTYSDKAHHGEVKRNAKFLNDAPPAMGQKLADDKGVNAAISILADQFKKK